MPSAARLSVMGVEPTMPTTWTVSAHVRPPLPERQTRMSCIASRARQTVVAEHAESRAVAGELQHLEGAAPAAEAGRELPDVALLAERPGERLIQHEAGACIRMGRCVVAPRRGAARSDLGRHSRRAAPGVLLPELPAAAPPGDAVLLGCDEPAVGASS